LAAGVCIKGCHSQECGLPGVYDYSKRVLLSDAVKPVIAPDAQGGMEM
jgi:hypothetical protein